MTTVGVLGGGQLGMMLAQAATGIGVRCRFLDPNHASPAGREGELIVADYDDPEALARLCAGADAATCEFENVPASAASFVSQRVRFVPGAAALETAQERYRENALFADLGVPTPAFAPVDDLSEMVPALERVGLPAVCKTRRMGYDGKGQFIVRDMRDAPKAWTALGQRPLLFEQLVEFQRELSIIAVRGADGSEAFYPLVENHHEGGILRLTIAPAPGVSAELQAEAEGIARRVLEALGYIGVLTVELFHCPGAEPELLANEMAPRVHNSGHWTIEGAECSQFENHIRACVGMDLGPARPKGPSAMINILGAMPPEPALREIGSLDGVFVHSYGKAERPGRKIGHITVVAGDEASRDETTRRVLDLSGIADPGAHP